MNLEDMRDLMSYISENVEDYEYRVQHAMTIMDRNRCPLCYADLQLCNEIQDAVDDYCFDNDLDADDLFLEDLIFC